MRALKKIMAALALTAVLAGCSAHNILSSIQGGKAGTVQTVSRPAVESAELQFTHPAAGDTIAVFDTSAGVFKAVLFSTEAPQAVQNFTTLAQQGFYNGLTVTRVEKDFVVEAGQGADGRGTTIWNGNRFSAETTDKLHHYSGALCAAADASGDCASVFYVMETLPGSSSVTQELIDQMNAAGWRGERLPDGGRRTLPRLHRHCFRAGVRRDGSSRHHRPDRRGRNSAPDGGCHHQQRDHHEIRIRSWFSALRAVGRLQKITRQLAGDLRLWGNQTRCGENREEIRDSCPPAGRWQHKSGRE